MLTLLLAILLVCPIVYGSLIPPVTFGNTIRDLYATDSGDMIMMASQWTINGSISNTTVVSRCIEPYLGGVGTVAPQGSFTRSYTNLPIHSVVDLALNVRVIDIEGFYATGVFRVKIDGVYYQTVNLSTVPASVNYCGGQDPDVSTNLSLTNIPHGSGTEITIEISWEMDSPSGMTAFAIRDLVLSFQNGTNNCPTGFYNNNGICAACNSACQNCFGPSSSQCFPCQMGYNLIGNECVQCPSDCSLCSGSNVSQCLLCNPGYTLDFDGTCNPQKICKSSPYVIKDNNELMNYGYSLSVCASSCSEGEAILLNSVCTACYSPLQKVTTTNGTLVCESPCNSAYEYLLPNGSCSWYCPGSARYLSGFLLCDLPCNQYLYANGSCLPTCAAPYAVGEYMFMMTCENPCSYREYLYPNGTCQNTCPQDYLSSYESRVSGGTTATCSFPCDSNQYLYQNGNCSATCRPDFIESIDSNNNKVCNFPCYYSGGVLYDNGTCSYNCPHEFVYYESFFRFCRFPCASNQYFSNGRCIGSCEAGSTPRIEGSFRFCDSNTTIIRTDEPCSSRSFYKYQNGSCLRTCPLPLLATWRGYYSNAYCNYPCSPGNYLYPNISCLPNCESGFVPRIEGDNRFCDLTPTHSAVSYSAPCFIYSEDGVMTTNCSNANNTCPPGYFQYQNGSCLSSCRDPYYSILRSGSAYCSSQCASNEFLYPNGTCSATCTHGMSISENNFGFCDINQYNSTNGTCPQGFFKYDNGSCLSTCLFPLSTIWEDGNAFCRSPCSPGSYLYPNGTCSWSCFSSSRIVVEGSIQYCKPLCSENQYRYYDTCLSTCDYPRKSFIHFSVAYCYDVPLTDCDIYNSTWNMYGYNFYGTSCSNPYNDCESFYFEYEDGSCLSGCRYPMIPEIRNFSAFCVKDPNYTGPDNTACWPWEYTYPNGSCLSTCSLPYVGSYQNNSNFCNPQCPIDMYAYDNGNCLPTCGDRFISLETDGYKSCKFPCYTYQYLLPDNSCSYFCESGIVESLNDTFMICNPDNHTGCGTYEYNGQIRTNCSNPSSICGSGLFQYTDNTCADSCMYPYVPLIVNSAAYCILNTSSSSCPSGEFMYYNGSCQPSCPPPLQANWNATSGSSFCNSPCSYGAYVYENGTCSWSCPYPYVSSGEAPYLFCNAPCPAGEYLYPSDGNCTTSCRPGTQPYVDLGINYCIDSTYGCGFTVGGNGSYETNCTNPDHWCDEGQFLRSDSNCSTTCDPPSVPYISGSSAYCVINQTNTIEPYCEIYSSLFSDATNCTNPSNNCAGEEFEYPDGHCDYYCYHPSYYSYISNFSAYCAVNSTNTNTTNPNHQPNTTDLYCETYSFMGNSTTNCTNPSNNCSQNQFLYTDGHCDYYCYHSPYIFNFSAYCVVSSTNTNTTNPNNQTNTTEPYCEIYSLMGNSTTNCTNPSNNCGQNQFLYTDGHCDYYCSQPSYSPYIFNFSAYCAINSTNTTNPNNQTNNTGTVSLQLYIRYNMSLIDFNSQNGLNIFIQQLALILGVNPSDIIIIDIREGSTIIESQLIMTSESDQDSMNTGSSRAQEMSNRYSSAIGNQQLNIFTGVDILDSRQSVQVSTPSAGSVSQVLASKSSSGSAVGIGIGVGLAALFMVVGGYWLYRRYRTRKDVRSTNTESYVVRGNANQNQHDQEANDGTSMVIRTDNETAFQPKPSAPKGLEFGQERDISFEKEMKDIEKIGQDQGQEQAQEQGQEREREQQDDNEEMPLSLGAILNLDNIDINISS